MNITLHNLGRRFNQEWIFRNIDFTFIPSQKYAVLGPNGSGKSTFLKVIAGQLSSSEGSIKYYLNEQDEVQIDEVYQYLSIAAPYLELIEEFTLSEILDFHFKFKSYFGDFNKKEVVAVLGMEKSLNKSLKYFSSGMKQRVKLALACFSKSDLLLLDEPTSNLDLTGEQWYLDLVKLTSTEERILVIGSNQEKEYQLCNEYIQIANHK